MKVAIVTGASGGIGGAVAEKLIDDGFFVFAHYNNNKKGVDELAKKLGEKSQNLFAVKADLLNLADIDKMASAVLKSFSHVDVVINNAGAGLYKLITETTEKEWDDIFNLNVKSAYYLTNKFLPSMIDRTKGKIVNVSSMWGQVGASMEVAYSASKAALIGYTKALAKELAPSNINVNCVCPGVIDTPINARFSKEEMDCLANETPLGRIGKSSEVAELISFLCSEKADFITGQVIACDGGFSL